MESETEYKLATICANHLADVLSKKFCKAKFAADARGFSIDINSILCVRIHVGNRISINATMCAHKHHRNCYHGSFELAQPDVDSRLIDIITKLKSISVNLDTSTPSRKSLRWALLHANIDMQELCEDYQCLMLMASCYTGVGLSQLLNYGDKYKIWFDTGCKPLQLKVLAQQYGIEVDTLIVQLLTIEFILHMVIYESEALLYY